MRFYDLEIGENKEIHFTSRNLWGNKVPLNIEFECNMYGNSTVVTPGFIRIYNPSVAFYIKTQELIGKPIKLKVGWEDSVFARKLGWKYITDTLIVNMFVSNTLADFSGTNPFIDIYFIPQIDNEQTENEEFEKETQIPLIKVEIEKGEKIFNAIKKSLELVLSGYAFVARGNFKNTLNTSTQTLAIFANTIDEFIKKLKNAKEPNILTILNLKDRALEFKEANDQDAYDEYGIIYIKPNELLSQPQLVGLEGQMSVILRMRPDLNLGMQIFLEGNLPSTAGFKDKSGQVPTNINTKNIFATGYYTITQITHRGVYHSNNAMDWATTLLLSPDVTTAKGYL